MKKRFQTVSVWFLLATGIYIVSEIYRSNIIEDWAPTNPIIYGAILLFFALFDPAKKTSAKILTCISIAACIRCVGTLDRLRCNETTSTKFLTVLFITVALCTLTIMAFVQTNILTNRLKIFQNIPAVCMLGVFMVNGTDFLRLLLDGKLDWFVLLNCIVYLFLMLGARQLSKIFCRLGYESAGEEVPPFGIWHALRKKQFHINSVWFLVALVCFAIYQIIECSFFEQEVDFRLIEFTLVCIFLTFSDLSSPKSFICIALWNGFTALILIAGVFVLFPERLTILELVYGFLPVVAYGTLICLASVQFKPNRKCFLYLCFVPTLCMSGQVIIFLSGVPAWFPIDLSDELNVYFLAERFAYFFALVTLTFGIYKISLKVYKLGIESARKADNTFIPPKPLVKIRSRWFLMAVVVYIVLQVICADNVSLWSFSDMLIGIVPLLPLLFLPLNKVSGRIGVFICICLHLIAGSVYVIEMIIGTVRTIAHFYVFYHAIHMMAQLILAFLPTGRCVSMSKRHYLPTVLTATAQSVFLFTFTVKPAVVTYSVRTVIGLVVWILYSVCLTVAIHRLGKSFYEEEYQKTGTQGTVPCVDKETEGSTGDGSVC